MSGEKGKKDNIYTSFGEKIDVYFPYGKDYGNNMTPSEMYAFLGERLQMKGLIWKSLNVPHPAQFDVFVQSEPIRWSYD